MEPAWPNLDFANMDSERRARRLKLKADIDEAEESFARTMAILEKEDAEMALDFRGLNFECHFIFRMALEYISPVWILKNIPLIRSNGQCWIKKYFAGMDLEKDSLQV
jgi:hypothetical protein